VHARRESLLGGSAVNAANSAAEAERAEGLRAETVALLDDLKEKLSKAEIASESYKRQTEVLQSRLDEAIKEQAKLEEKVHENEEQIEALTNEKREAARQMREMESIYEAERAGMMKEKEEMANREEEMQSVIQRLKDSLAQRNLDEDRPSRHCKHFILISDRGIRANHTLSAATNSPSLDSGSFAPPSSIHRSDSRNKSNLLLQKDKLIESLRLELAEAQIKLVESENQGGGRLQEVERQLMEARMANARLMEDNESYQLLLQERTLKGDFGTTDFSYMAPAANQDALAALEGRVSHTSLADELSEVAEDDHHQPQQTQPSAQESAAGDTETSRRLEAELKSVKDQNKALTLYINKIIERLLQHQEFEHILDQTNDFKADGKPANTNKELPPPPSAGPSLLQRAKSIATGPAGRPKPRPMSFMPQTNANGQSALNNPETAPSIPIGLGRTSSTRRGGRPMSDHFTGTAAAGIVNAMYKGNADGPLSPSFRTSQTFNFIPQGAGNRASSGGGTSSAASNRGDGYSTSGNFPGMRSETSSMSGDSVHNYTGDRDRGDGSSSLHSSPPRSHHEKNTTFAGNKPRPLRLVQENSEAVAAANANKRQSWIGWAFGGKKGDDAASSSGGSAVNDVIRE